MAPDIEKFEGDDTEKLITAILTMAHL